MTCWGENLTKQDTSRINKLIKKAGLIIGKTQESIETRYHKWSRKQMSNILPHDSHPLRPEFDSRLIVCSGRLRAPRYRTMRYSSSFVPMAIRKFNDSINRLFTCVDVMHVNYVFVYIVFTFVCFLVVTVVS